jgi:hypothetical protein
MAEIPSRRGRITRDTGKSRSDHRQYCGGSGSKMAKNGRMAAEIPVLPAISAVMPAILVT